MADWQVVSLRFLGPVPSEELLKIIEDRTAKHYHKPYGNVPAGAELAVTHFGDYDFPGFDRKPVGMDNKTWRSPLDLDLFCNMLHFLGYPNEFSAYSTWEAEDEEFTYPSWTKSNPLKLTAEEREMLRKLYPEFAEA